MADNSVVLNANSTRKNENKYIQSYAELSLCYCAHIEPQGVTGCVIFIYVGYVCIFAFDEKREINGRTHEIM